MVNWRKTDEHPHTSDNLSSTSRAAGFPPPSDPLRPCVLPVKAMKDLGQLGTYGSTLAIFRNGLSREPETELRGGWSSEEKAVVEDALFRLLGCRFSGELLGHRPLMIHRRVVKTVLMEGFTRLVLLPFCFLEIRFGFGWVIDCFEGSRGGV